MALWKPRSGPCFGTRLPPPMVPGGGGGGAARRVYLYRMSVVVVNSMSSEPSAMGHRAVICCRDAQGWAHCPLPTSPHCTPGVKSLHCGPRNGPKIPVFTLSPPLVTRRLPYSCCWPAAAVTDGVHYTVGPPWAHMHTVHRPGSAETWRSRESWLSRSKHGWSVPFWCPEGPPGGVGGPVASTSLKIKNLWNASKGCRVQEIEIGALDVSQAPLEQTARNAIGMNSKHPECTHVRPQTSGNQQQL